MIALPSTAVHFVDASNWPAVQREGLRTAASLMRAAGVDESAHRRFRPSGEVLPSGAYIRDQKPMPPATLARCLDAGLGSEDWYALVNNGVYFWLDRDRADRHQRALRGRPQVRLELSVERILDDYGKSAFVTPFNIGSAVRRPAQRGLRSLVPVERFREAMWLDEATPNGKVRLSSHRPAELVIQRDIPDALSFVQRMSFITDDGSIS